jgi:TetR/AcrR family transcriptional repressor of nem operon
MCPLAVLGAGSLDLPKEVSAEVRRFYQMCLEKMIGGGLSQNAATELLATITGAIVVATALDDFTAYDRATSELLRSNVSHERAIVIQHRVDG